MRGERIAVIGGGAAGMMATAFLLKGGAEVLLFERNEKFGRKLGITGKGRCNLTNDCSLDTLMENIPTNPRFLYSAFAAFSPADTMAYFRSLGVELKTERGNRVFPASDRASDIVNALRRAISGAKTVHERVSGILTSEDAEGKRRVTEVVTEEGGSYPCDRVIVATGGCSYPVTGSDGDGYRFAKALGIEVVPPVPSLCPMETEENWCKALMGLSLKNVSLTFTDLQSGKTVYSDFGEMLFTHFGVSGPMILSASAHLGRAAQGRYRATLNLKPALDDKQLDARLLREFAAAPNKNYSNILSGLLPAKMIPVFARMSGIDMGKKVHDITKEERGAILQTLRGMQFTVKGLRPIAEAIVTKGGVSVKELNPKTMETKSVKGLYFAGEVIDVDGYTGGFNLQIAFSTAVLAARAVLRSLNETAERDVEAEKRG